MSVNIYNARREDRWVASSYFVMYRDGGEDKILHGSFVVEVDGDYNVLAVLRQ